ncbi:protein of unknown function [Lachnospiraceae bacterium A10]|nr:protein of unknown function [Lachnospiraceae bacterium A10]
MKELKILVCCHKESMVPTDEMYLPIHVGKERSNIVLDMQTDCECNGEVCDNISAQNNVYCEMTAMYWAWKNITKVYPEVEYIGLCHYRRFFNANWSIVDKFGYLIKKILFFCASIVRHKVYAVEAVKSIDSVNGEDFVKSSKKLRSFIAKYDFVSTNPVAIINCSTEMFFQVIGRKHIDLLTEIIDGKYEKYSDVYHEQLNSNRLYAQNMMIAKYEIFNEYCEFVFGVLEEHIKMTKENNICKDPLTELAYDRVSGYLSEILTSTFVRYTMKKYKVGLTGKFFIK